MFKLSISAFLLLFVFSVNGNVDTYNSEHLNFVEDFLTDLPQHLNRTVEQLLREHDQPEDKLRLKNPETSQCLKELEHVFTGIVSKELWAIKVVDSWGKLPSGVLSGNLFDLGDFEQCLSIDEPGKFVARYLLVHVSTPELFGPDQVKSLETVRRVAHSITHHPQTRAIQIDSNLLGLNIGLCVPKNCTTDAIQHTLDRLSAMIPKVTISLKVVPDTSQTKEDVQYTGGEIACITFLSFIGALLIISTIYDIVRTKQKKSKFTVMIAFSMYTNGQKIFASRRSKSADVMDCLNGIRVFSAAWVLFAHAHIMVLLGPSFNLAYIPVWISHYSTILFLMTPYSVDSFLFLSGLLATMSMLKTLTKSKGRINFLMLYVHRYLRLTPLFAILILVSITIVKKLGSGPMWYAYLNNTINCDDNWWAALLYIQNYYNPKFMCLAHSWYLSADMQLYIAAPLLVWFLYRFTHKFLPILVAIVLGSMGWTIYLFIHHNLSSKFLNLQNDWFHMFLLTYFPTHLRLGPWIIGMIFGYFLFAQRNLRVRWNKAHVILCWLAVIVLVGVLGYYTYALQQIDRTFTPLESGLYTSLSRIVWSIILCLIIYPCIKGYGGPVNWFLSLQLWQPLARLSYSLYLIHMPIMLVVMASSKRPIYFSEQNIIFKFFGDFTISLLISIFASMAFESPFIVLEKLLFSCKLKSVETNNRENEAVRS